jgi:hypothetical protein
MSSHHFVKEGQEAALVVVDPPQFHSIASVLEWSPLVIVFEDALDEVLSWSIKIDVVACAPASVDEMSRKLEHQAPTRFLTLAREGRDLEDVLDFLIQEDHSSVMVAQTNVDGIMDRLTSVQKIRLSLITGGIRWSLIATGSYDKWLSVGDGLMLRGVFPQPTKGAICESDRITATEDGVIHLKSPVAFWVGEKL